MTEGANEPKRRRGIFLLPNLFTTAALFSGFYAIVAAMNGRFAAAAVAVFVAQFMDGIDGRIARLTNTQSDFGVEYDSLSDMVAFGLAPALVVYSWSLSTLGKLGWLGAFIYTAAAALRLARFNTQVEVIDRRFFQGLPSPPAAALVAGMVWVASDFDIAGDQVAFPVFLVTIAIGLLMVSNVRYYSFKDIDLKGRVPFVAILLVVLVYVFISIDPPIVLCAMALIYALSGPALTLHQLRKRRRERRKAEGEDRGNGEDAGSGEGKGGGDAPGGSGG